MQKEKISNKALALVAVLVVGLGVGAYAAIQSAGDFNSTAGELVEYNVSAYMESELWSGAYGLVSGNVGLSEGEDVFVNFGSSGADYLVATTSSMTLNDSSFWKMASSDLTRIDSLLGLSGDESFTGVFGNTETLTFANYNDTTAYKQLPSGFRTYVVKLKADQLDGLFEVAFVTEVKEGWTSFKNTTVDYELLVFGTNTYYVSTV